MNKSVLSKHLFLIVTFILCGNLLAPSVWEAQGAVSEKDKYGGTLRIAVSREPLSLDARQAGPSSTNQWGFQQIYSHLAEFGEKNMDMTPGLAVKWEKKDDLTWIVHLRKGIKYHNGKEMTAEDVALNFDWKINSGKYQKEKGWKPPRGKSSITALKKVTALDRYTLRFDLNYPFASFVNVILGWGLQYGPIDPEIVEKYDRAVSMHPVGTGPFKFVEYVTGDHITLERFNGYWGRKPYLDKVLFRFFPDAQTRLLALQKGEVDIAEIDPRSVTVLEKDPNIKIFKIAPPTRMEGVLWFNFRRWPMNQVKFRRAVAMGADWRAVAKAAVPKDCYIPLLSLFKNSFVENPEAEKWFPTYNPKEAKRLISEVEKEAGKPIPHIYIVVDEKTLGENIAMLASGQFKKIGMNIDVQPLDRNVAINVRARDPKSPWDITIAGKKGAGIDPNDAVRDFYSKNRSGGDGKNRAGYEDPKVDELILKAVGAYDRKERIAIYREIEKVLMKDQMAILPIVSPPWVYGVRKNVQDFKPHISSFLYIVSPWSNIWLKR